MMMNSSRLLCSIAACAVSLALCQAARADDVKPAAKAAATVAKMPAAVKVVLTNGIMALAFAPGTVLPADAVPGAGYVPGVPRLNIPSLKDTDASLAAIPLVGERDSPSHMKFINR